MTDYLESLNTVELRKQRRRQAERFVEEVRRRASRSVGAKSREVLLALSEFESPGNCCYGIYEYPVVVDRASGARVWDVDGKEYVDCLSGFSIANVGHQNELVLAALSEQLGKVPQYGEMPTEARLLFARRLVKTFPGSGAAKCILAVTGSEAVEVAVKLARWYTGRSFVLVPYGDFHGCTSGTIAFTSRASLWEYYNAAVVSQPVAYFEYPYCLRCAYDKTHPDCDLYCVSALESRLLSGISPLLDPLSRRCDVAAILVEPMQASNGYIVPPVEYLQRLRDLCDRYGALLIVDEVQAGLGRSGKMWATEYAGVVPDLMTVGKSLGGGVPMSAVLGRSEIMNSWGLIAHGSTFGGYALGCAGGLAVLDVLESDGFLAKVVEKGRYFVDRLRNTLQLHSIPAFVEGQGLFIGVEFVKKDNANSPDADMARHVRDEGLLKGLICELAGPFGNRLNLIPPLTIEEDLIDRAVEIICVCASEFQARGV